MSGSDAGDTTDESSDNDGAGSHHGPHDASSDGTGDPNHGDDPTTDRADRSTRPSAGTETRARSSNRADENGASIAEDGLVRWFLRTNDDSVVLVRDVLTSVAIVAVVGLLLFGVSGIWPPLVAVESGSMEPNMERGDLIFVAADDRFAGDDPVDGTGVVTLENGEGDYEKFGKPGDVIVFQPNGNDRQTPIIHRAHFWVEEGENWVDTKANEEYVDGATCTQVQTCPASHDGFITKGDANSYYDQYQGGAPTDVVRADWVTGKAMVRVPWLGYVRLTFDAILGEILAPSPTAAAGGSIAGTSPIPAANLASATGVAATGTGVAMAAGRRRRER